MLHCNYVNEMVVFYVTMTVIVYGLKGTSTIITFMNKRNKMNKLVRDGMEIIETFFSFLF